MVLAQVAVAAGQRDFLRIGGDFLFHQLAVFVLAPLQALPGHQQGGLLLRLVARNQHLDRRVALHDAGQQRALVHVIERRRELQGAREVFDDFEVGRADEFHQQLLVVEDKVAQPVGAPFVELVALHRGQHRAEDFRPEDVRERVVPVFGEPEQQLAAGRVLADEPRHGFLEQFDLAFLNEETGQLAAEFGGNAVERRLQRAVPVLGIGGLE